MIVNSLNPILFSIGPLSVRWYGLMYVVGFLFTYWFCQREIRLKRFELSEKQLDTLMFSLVIAMVIGARTFEVLFWQPAYYFANPLKIFAIWEGGLAFHGSLVAMLLTTIYLARKWKIRIAKLVDFLIVPLSFTSVVGRIGNFFNHELFGKVSSLPWAVNFNGETDLLGELVFRHPNQLYESLYNLVIFAILMVLKRRGVPTGVLFATWLGLYGFFRFFTEFLRVAEPLFGPLTAGQWFNLAMIAGAALWLKFVTFSSSSSNNS